MHIAGYIAPCVFHIILLSKYVQQCQVTGSLPPFCPTVPHVEHYCIFLLKNPRKTEPDAPPPGETDGARHLFPCCGASYELQIDSNNLIMYRAWNMNKNDNRLPVNCHNKRLRPPCQ